MERCGFLCVFRFDLQRNGVITGIHGEVRGIAVRLKHVGFGVVVLGARDDSFIALEEDKACRFLACADDPQVDLLDISVAVLGVDRDGAEGVKRVKAVDHDALNGEFALSVECHVVGSGEQLAGEGGAVVIGEIRVGYLDISAVDGGLGILVNNSLSVIVTVEDLVAAEVNLRALDGVSVLILNTEDKGVGFLGVLFLVFRGKEVGVIFPDRDVETRSAESLDGGGLEGGESCQIGEVIEHHLVAGLECALCFPDFRRLSVGVDQIDAVGVLDEVSAFAEEFDILDRELAGVFQHQIIKDLRVVVAL